MRTARAYAELGAINWNGTSWQERQGEHSVVVMTDAFSGRERSRHMGELKRGPNRWDVYLEVQPDAELGAVRGRIHFVGTTETSHKATGWVFLEWQEQDIVERFGEFSAVELLQFVEAIPN